MKNRNIIRSGIFSLLALAFIFYSCQKELAVENPSLNVPHSFKIFLTDHATPIFDSVFIDIQRLEVKLEDDSLSNGGWIDLSIRTGVYNILRFRNGIDTLFATGTFPNARLKKIRMTLGNQNSVMKDGQSFPLTVKSGDREIDINIEMNNFEINNGQISFWIDFDAGRSIQIDNSGSGNNNGYRLKSHIKIFSNSHSGRIEGRVLPLAADPIIKAIIGSDTATAIPDRRDGEFKIVGLNPGTYSVFIDGNNNYRDTIINNVVVRKGEDTNLPLITLRQ